jgi:ribosomal protein S18 acetylase RimI-like enzyme
MTRLVRLDAARIESILDESYPIWGEGLTRQAYGRWNHAQMETPWGRANLSRVGLVSGDELLASAKRYDLTARLGARVVPVLGIGAVFTSPSKRRRGFGRALLDALLEDAFHRGCEAALLFSEIDPEYYEQSGFRIVQIETTTLAVATGPRGAPAMLVRSGDARDLEHVAEIWARRAQGAAFALDRTPDFIAFTLARRRLAVGLGTPGVRTFEFFVAEEAHRAVAYVVLLHGPQETWLEDCGDLDPTGARVGAMLQVLAARAPAETPLPIRTWLPPNLCPPQIRTVRVQPAAEVMMLRSLTETQAVPSAAVYCHLDAF